MVTESSLNGLKVLVTRPEHQARSLCDLVTAAGGQAIALPVFDIEPISPWNGPNIRLADQDMIIFISRNAVTHFMAQLHEQISSNTRCVAVGAATTASMTEHGLRVDIQAPPPAGSESLLAMPELNAVEGKNILIVRGEGGRELLADTLLSRGARINYIEVYRRALPTLSKAIIEQAKTADCIVITSVTGLENLCQFIDVSELIPKSLIVMSERIRQYALDLGFQYCVVADDASDAAVMQQINWMELDDGKKR